MKHTSLELSKKLKGNGFIKETKMVWCKDVGGHFIGRLDHMDYLPFRGGDEPSFVCNAYDILNDLCVKYAKEVFGIADTCYECCLPIGKCVCDGDIIIEKYRIMHKIIMPYLLNNKKQEAEDCLWEHCLFNKEK